MSATGEKLPNHPSRRRQAVGPGCGCILGLVFLLVGALAALSAVDLLPMGASIPGRARPWVMGSGAISAILIGLWLIGVAMIRSYLRRAGAKPRGPGEPWRQDHPWNPRWADDELSEKLGSGGLGHALTLGFFTPIFVLGVLESDGNGCIVAILVVIAVIYLSSFFSWLYRLLRRLKFGAPRLRLGTCPFLLGNKVDVVVTNVHNLDRLRKITATLRFIEEREEESKSDEKGVKGRASYAMWKAATEIGEPRRALRQKKDLPLTFQLPENPALATRLANDPPRYWELEVHGEAPGIDFKARFLVPVYADPRARKAGAGWQPLEGG